MVSTYRERTTAATRRAAATSSPSAAPTAADARPRTRPSSVSPFATWSSLLLFVRIHSSSLDLPLAIRQLVPTGILGSPANILFFPQVISLTPRSSPSTPSPRCTSSCSTASLAPFTARSFGTFVSDGGQLSSTKCHRCSGLFQGEQWYTSSTQAAEKNLGGTTHSITLVDSLDYSTLHHVGTLKADSRF